jgi:hypothetical protein
MAGANPEGSSLVAASDADLGAIAEDLAGCGTDDRYRTILNALRVARQQGQSDVLGRLPRYNIEGRYGGSYEAKRQDTGEWVRFSDVEQALTFAAIAPCQHECKADNDYCTLCGVNVYRLSPMEPK